MIAKVLAMPRYNWIGLLGVTAIAVPLVWQPAGFEGHEASYLLVILSVFLAATISSIAGFAFSAIAGASILHLVDDPVDAVKVMIVASIAIQSYSVAVLWRAIEWRSLMPFLFGGALTLPLGLYLLVNASAIGYWKTMGAFLVIYALVMLFRGRPTTYPGSVYADVAAGALGGITGGAAGFPGAFVTIWCSMRGWDKNRQRALYQPFILAMQLMAMFGLEVLGAGQRVGLTHLAYVPAALLGACCGLAIFKRLTDRHFNLVIYVFLIVSGVALMAK